MSEAAATTPTAIPAERKTVAGTVFTVETVPLPAKGENEAAREMGVVWIIDAEGNPERYTDFSGMHKTISEDVAIKAVFDESIETGEYPRVHRNLVSVKQG